ncbi:hypothetical protein [Lysinibacillus sp. NPDC059133]|uniref:hypothetical protein n=1 Tax=Lysinibacillus sp. NPDC059133 TaxID=3346737 RepID=UPI0036A6B9DB
MAQTEKVYNSDAIVPCCRFASQESAQPERKSPPRLAENSYFQQQYVHDGMNVFFYKKENNDGSIFRFGEHLNNKKKNKSIVELR